LLTKVMFDKNPDHDFYIEESFPLKWMHPHLTPFGIIMKIERNPVAELSEEQMQRDHEFWSQYSARFIGNWLKESTPISEICNFALKTYQRRDLAGFTGDPKFVRDDNAQKAFSKLRNAQGKSIYGWRSQYSTNPVTQQRYLREAEYALKQAFAFCPYSPETTWNLASLLAATGRQEDALIVAKTCEAFDLENNGIRDLVRQLERVRGTAGTTPVNAETLANLEAQIRSSPTNFGAGFQAAATLFQSGRSNEAIAVFDSLLASSSDVGQLLQLAEGYREVIRPDRMETTLLKITKLAPSSADGWLNLSQVQAAIGKKSEAKLSLERAFQSSDAQLKSNSALPDLRKLFPKDPRFQTLRSLLEE
jgi:tetratricopeptide (TPR) repeat protein